jgi:hypothetical protein
MPVARHNARAPAMLRPAVEVFERYGIKVCLPAMNARPDITKPEI